MIYHCHNCGAVNKIVNQCGCDPNNMPTRPDWEKIMKEYQTYHHQLWGWLAENPQSVKFNWPYWNLHQEVADLHGCCFACKFANMLMTSHNDEDPAVQCGYCPITWVDSKYPDKRGCGELESPYTWWHAVNTIGERIKYAKIIRDLPWTIKIKEG